MTEPYLKAIPEGDKIHFVMDRAGFELFERAMARMKPLPQDSPINFNKVKDRLEGALLAAASQMGWRK